MSDVIKKDLVSHPVDDLTLDEMRVFIMALRSVVRLLRVDVARNEKNTAKAMLSAASYRLTLSDIRLTGAEAESRGEQ